jgi:hypothetical protein
MQIIKRACCDQFSVQLVILACARITVIKIVSLYLTVRFEVIEFETLLITVRKTVVKFVRELIIDKT